MKYFVTICTFLLIAGVIIFFPTPENEVNHESNKAPTFDGLKMFRTQLPQTKDGNIDVSSPLPGPWAIESPIVVKWKVDSTLVKDPNANLTLELWSKSYDDTKTLLQTFSNKYAFNLGEASVTPETKVKRDGTFYYFKVTLDDVNWGTSGPFMLYNDS
ncbi:hypothetical protein G9A89_005001 [Geosiphon pyriformis]|nr:hypothetical protein G9A89_005001 [Geosiphon pyriformis]